MRARPTVGSLLCALLLALALGAVPAQASRGLFTEKAVNPEDTPIFEEEIEGACGVAVGAGGAIHVSDYYHHSVEVFTAPFKIIPAGTPPEGPCGLAIDSKSSLYANIWHESVVRLTPSPQTFDSGKSTGVAVDAADNVYVDDRTYVAVYEPSGAPVLSEGQPLRIGLGSLGDAYGVATFGGRVYVPDASTGTVKVYQPSLDPLDPAAVLTDSSASPFVFNSLVDAAVTVDPTNGHVLVLDNLQPGYEHPVATVYEFDASGAFLDRLPGEPVDGGPSGLAVDPATGRLYVTEGNSEESNVFGYTPYVEGTMSESPTDPGSPEQVLPLVPASGERPPGSSSSPVPAPPSSAHRRAHRGHRRHHRSAQLGPARAAFRS